MKIATWNVNSLRVRLPHVLDWLERQRPDFLALQEIKITDDQCPFEAIREAGYHTIISGQRGYHGVAILSRQPVEGQPIRELPGFPDPERRIIAADYGALRLINIYVPNGQRIDSDKYTYKLEWLDHLTAWLREELRRKESLVLVGDFNIAPEPRDVFNPELWEGRVLFSGPERAAFRRFVGMGLTDTFRLFEQEAANFSWWDYRMGAFRRNRGLRIDHILASPALVERCTASRIDTEPRGLERPSDHAPVVAEFRD